jgi:hypothetical protein
MVGNIMPPKSPYKGLGFHSITNDKKIRISKFEIRTFSHPHLYPPGGLPSLSRVREGVIGYFEI